MKRLIPLLLLVSIGCSTAPVADVLDVVRPGRIGPGPYHGGVGAQHRDMGGAAPALVAPAEPIPPAGMPSPAPRPLS